MNNMLDSGSSEEDERFCSQLLGKLERPLSFIGEKRNRYIMFEGSWVDVDKLLDEATGDPRKRDKMMPVLMKRLNEIRSDLSSTCMTREEAIDLYEEGIAIKRAIHILNSRGVKREEDPHGDTRRWLNYGRQIG
jgi:hypothetical protein